MAKPNDKCDVCGHGKARHIGGKGACRQCAEDGNENGWCMAFESGRSRKVVPPSKKEGKTPMMTDESLLEWASGWLRENTPEDPTFRGRFLDGLALELLRRLKGKAMSDRVPLIDYVELEAAAKELIGALDGVAVRAPEKQARRYSTAFDRLCSAVGRKGSTVSERVVSPLARGVLVPPRKDQPR